MCVIFSFILMHKAKAAAYKNINFAVIYRVYILRAFVDLLCLTTKCFCYIADIHQILQGVLIAIGPEIDLSNNMHREAAKSALLCDTKKAIYYWPYRRSQCQCFYLQQKYVNYCTAIWYSNNIGMISNANSSQWFIIYLRWRAIATWNERQPR